MEKKGKNIGATITIVAIIALFLGVVVWRIIDKSANQIDHKKYDAYSVIEANEENGNISDHVKGDLDKAKVIIYEYADFQCSGCASANPKVNKLLEEYKGEVAVVYRNFLLSYHQNGTAAASAAEAAGLQGFWQEYADLLFKNQSVWANATGDNRTSIFVDFFKTVAGEKGDVNKFLSDMTSEAVKKKIDFDMAISKNVDIQATPSFFLDGELIDFAGANGEEGFLNAFREKIDAKL